MFLSDIFDSSCYNDTSNLKIIELRTKVAWQAPDPDKKKNGDLDTDPGAPMLAATFDSYVKEIEKDGGLHIALTDHKYLAYYVVWIKENSTYRDIEKVSIFPNTEIFPDTANETGTRRRRDLNGFESARIKKLTLVFNDTLPTCPKKLKARGQNCTVPGTPNKGLP